MHYKVSIKTYTGREFGATFDEIELANAWINNQKKKQSWGLPEREVIVHEHQSVDSRAELVEEYSDGSKKFIIPCDYEIVIQEIEGSEPAEVYFERLRSERLKILAESDPTMLADYPMSSAEKKDMREYRAYLRDLPSKYNNSTVHKYKIMSFGDYISWRESR